MDNIQTAKKFIRDDYEEIFEAGGEEAFLNEVKELELAGEWTKINTNELDLVPCKGGKNNVLPFNSDAVRNEMVPGTSEELFLDTVVSGSHLFLKTHDGLVPLRSIAIEDLFDAAICLKDGKLAQDTVNDPGFLAAVFGAAKNGVNRANRTNWIWSCANKVTAVGTDRYLIMPMDKVFDSVLPELRTRFGNLTFNNGSTSFSMVKANYTISGTAEIDTLRDKYLEMVQKYRGKKDSEQSNFVHDVMNVSFGIQVQTSNTKNSSAIVRAVIYNGTTSPIPVGSDLRVAHRTGTDEKQSGIEHLVSLLPKLFAKFCDENSALAKLMSVFLNHPVEALLSVAKKLNLPVRFSAMAAEELTRYLDAMNVSGCTAWDCYLSLCRIPEYAEYEGVPQPLICKYGEDVARALTANWHQNDFIPEPKTQNQAAE